MSIEITARHEQISAASKDYAQTKARALEAAFQKVASIKVTLDIEGTLYKAQVAATVAGTPYIGAANNDTNLHVAIDEAFSKVDHQIRKQKAKLNEATRGSL